MGRPKGTKYHRTIALRLEEELGDVIEQMAEAEDRPIGAMARILLREAVEARAIKLDSPAGHSKRKP
jgi:hypothetical protein